MVVIAAYLNIIVVQAELPTRSVVASKIYYFKFYMEFGIAERVRTEFVRDFCRKSPINPYALLGQLLYVHAFGGIAYSQQLLLVGIIFMLIYRSNYFWWWGLLIHPNLGWLAPLNILLGLLSCNERPKTLIFLYVATDLLLLEMPQVDIAFNVIALAGLLLEIYRNIPLNNINHNKTFFMSLTIVWLVEICMVLTIMVKLTT